MTENLRPVKSLIKSVNVRVSSGTVSRTDFDLITAMIKSSIDAFDSSIETTSGERFICHVVISLERTY